VAGEVTPRLPVRAREPEEATQLSGVGNLHQRASEKRTSAPCGMVSTGSAMPTYLTERIAPSKA
jgi:hypothetical protein